MTRNSISYPKVCNDKLGNYYVDFRLQQKRFRLFNGNKIGSSLSPNSYPAKMRRSITTELAREVYEYLINNDYSFEKKVSTLELYDSLVAKKLAEPLSLNIQENLKQLFSQTKTRVTKKRKHKANIHRQLNT